MSAPPSRARAVLGLIFSAALLQPGAFLIIVGMIGFGLFSVLVAFRAALLIVATTPGFPRPSPPMPGENIELPIYTVLVPLYREVGAIPGLADALSRLSWPAGRLDLILLAEVGDTETHAAVEASAWPEGTRCLLVPKGLPQTKPRALNYGLQYARGTMVCIYDAEDRPHPNQLKAAYSAFRQGDDTLACVQAPLAAYNHRQSWIALHWALEYAVQFGLLLPALARLKLPILLGGTSNHFRMSVLRSLGGWDAWNVTEDADLGVRLARHRYRSATISLPTFEEAPETLGIWTAQRSRWLKGFLQTWAVMTRWSPETIRQTGWCSYAALQAMLLGTFVAAIAHGPLAICALAWVVFGEGSFSGPGLYLLLAGYGVNVLGLIAAPGPRGMRRFIGALSLPLYWPLHSLAAVRALYGWLKTPHFWAKTPHGLTAHPC
ncbi:MAG: glycosyltransferase [Pseudomonadota bacterium]